MDVCVPTGNFGNILGAYYARAIGTPIGRLLCASNENNVLSDFIATGVYDVSGRRLVTTPSPSMDILISSNLERLLFELTRDGGRVRGWIDELRQLGRFRVDMGTFQRVREVFLGDWVTNDDSLATIRSVWDQYGYLLDPHTAVAWEVAERVRGDAPVLVVSTAHWAKFGSDVYRALTGTPADGPLPADVAGLGALELLARVSDMTGGQPVPRALAELGDAAVRFTGVVGSSVEDVEAAVTGSLG
jgi:threonine synthase